MRTIMAFFKGVYEFKEVYSTYYNSRRLDGAYDSGRAVAQWVTAGQFGGIRGR